MSVPHDTGPVIRQEYSLEYGTDCIEMHVGAIEKNERVVLIDDLIATGGTLGAAIKLLGTFLLFIHIFVTPTQMSIFFPHKIISQLCLLVTFEASYTPAHIFSFAISNL